MRVEELAQAGVGVVPEVGMKATVNCYSDAYPVTLVKVSPSKHVAWARRNVCIHHGASDFSQDWEITDTLEGELIKLAMKRNGSWKISNSTEYVQLGYAHKYFDYSF